MVQQTTVNRPGRIHGEFRSADGSVAEVTWYELGTTTARTQQADERVALLSAIVSADGAARIQVFADADDGNDVDAGEALIDVELAAGVPCALAWGYHNMPEGQTGAKIHIVADEEVAVSATFEGLIRTPTTKTGPSGAPPHDPNVGAR